MLGEIIKPKVFRNRRIPKNPDSSVLSGTRNEALSANWEVWQSAKKNGDKAVQLRSTEVKTNALSGNWYELTDFLYVLARIMLQDGLEERSEQEGGHGSVSVSQAKYLINLATSIKPNIIFFEEKSAY